MTVLDPQSRYSAEGFLRALVMHNSIPFVVRRLLTMSTSPPTHEASLFSTFVLSPSLICTISSFEAL